MSKKTIKEIQNVKKLITDVLVQDKRFVELKNLDEITDKIADGIKRELIAKCKANGMETIDWNDNSVVNIYYSVAKRLIINLDSNSSINKNKDENIRYYLINKLYEAIINENKKTEYNPDTIASLSSDKLNPHINKYIYDIINKRSKQKIEKKTSKIYLCDRCGGRNTEYHTLQTRGLDEDKTLFINCLENGCGHKWTQK